MKNIGPKSREWLAAAGIYSWDDVKKLGPVETYKRVKMIYPEKVTLNMLYALQAGLLDVPWNILPEEIKDDLKKQVEK